MRKRIFVALIVSLCVAEFAALAAVNQRGKAAQKETAETASVAARSAVRKDTVQKNGGVAARSAVKQTAPKSNVVAARAGTMQKAINTGCGVWARRAPPSARSRLPAPIPPSPMPCRATVRSGRAIC